MLTDALGLWRGPAYADLAGASFVLPEIARLDAMRTVAAELRLTAMLALGRHPEVLGELQALVLEQPQRERGWELLAVALYRAGGGAAGHRPGRAGGGAARHWPTMVGAPRADRRSQWDPSGERHRPAYDQPL